MNVTSSGSQSIGALGTEYTVFSDTVAGVNSFVADLSNLANGDTVLLKCYIKVASGGSSILAYQTYYNHTQSDKAKVSVPVLSPFGFSCSITQINGTLRTFPWAVCKL